MMLHKDYLAIRDSIKSGDILLCSGNSFFSKLIQKVTKSRWSHVAFILRIESIDRIMVLESVETIGVRTVPLSSYITNYNGTGKRYPGSLMLARHADFPESGVKTISQYAVDLLGYPYNTQEIAQIAGRIVADDNRPNQVGNGRQFICSEYVYLCFKSVGVAIDYDTRGFIAPKDFANCPQVKEITSL